MQPPRACNGLQGAAQHALLHFASWGGRGIICLHPKNQGSALPRKGSGSEAQRLCVSEATSTFNLGPQSRIPTCHLHPVTFPEDSWA